MTNPLSKAAIYQFSVDTQGQRHLAAINGQASAHCPASNSTFGYDGNSFLSDVTDGAGRVRHQVNDSRGRATLIVEGYGSPVARTTTITWNSAFSVPDQILEPGRTTSLTYDAARRLTGIADGTGGAIAYSLDTMGNPTQIQVTASGNTLVRSQTRAYDELGRLLARMSSASQNGAVRSYPTTPPGRGRPHCRPHPLGSSEAGAHPS